MPHTALDDEPVQKHTVRLFRGDFERLGTLYPEIGATQIIRLIIRRHIEDAESKIPQINVEV